jgi:flagellar biosynthesis/type III secretory pathway protein FliH
MNIEMLSNIIANQGFPIALSILLIFRIDRFMQEIVTAQKEGYRQILENTKEIHNTITSLNQQTREYYSLHFSEVQKELMGMKAELGKIK